MKNSALIIFLKKRAPAALSVNIKQWPILLQNSQLHTLFKKFEINNTIFQIKQLKVFVYPNSQVYEVTPPNISPHLTPNKLLVIC